MKQKKDKKKIAKKYTQNGWKNIPVVRYKQKHAPNKIIYENGREQA